MKHADRTIYLDISDLLANAKFQSRVAGIQRVTLRLIAQLLARRPETRISLIGLHPDLKQLVEVDSGWCTDYLDHDHLQFIRVFDLDLQTPLQYLRRYRNDPFRLLVHSTKILTNTVLPNERYFAKRHMRRPFGRKRSYGALLKPVELRAADRIVILGATWGLAQFAEILRKSSSEGISIIPFVHDLIPMVMPQHVRDGTRNEYDKWIRCMADLTRTFIANSQSTAADLSRHLSAIAPGRSYDITPVPLAHEFVERPYSSERSVRSSVLSAARLPYVLMVGTLESRKNVWGLANVWKRIVDKLGFNAPRLIFAGQRGWLSDDFYDFLRGTGYAYGYIRIVGDATDLELKYLYENCQFTVYPSYYEGWGLPVGESLWFGKVCVTSTTSAMPEVGGNMCVYANPHDLNDLHDKLLELVVDTGRRAELERRIDRTKLRRWRDVGNDLYAAISKQTAAAP
jgi:glycosyltransferase involved in cell wall biosynthesis